MFKQNRSPDIVRVIKSRRLRWEGYIARMERKVKILTGKPTENKLLGRPSLRWEDNIRMDLKEISVEELVLFGSG